MTPSIILAHLNPTRQLNVIDQLYNTCPRFVCAVGARTSWFAVALAVLTFLMPPTAIAQQPCTDDTVAAASSAFQFGRFPTTIGLLRQCLPYSPEPKPDRIAAYRLIALSYIATDSLVLARESVRAILRLDSGFRSDPNTDPPLFSEFVSEMRPRWYSWLYRGNEWYKWVGRGLIVGGVASISVALTRDSREPDLPAPPAFPAPR